MSLTSGTRWEPLVPLRDNALSPAKHRALAHAFTRWGGFHQGYRDLDFEELKNTAPPEDFDKSQMLYYQSGIAESMEAAKKWLVDKEGNTVVPRRQERGNEVEEIQDEFERAGTPVRSERRQRSLRGEELEDVLLDDLEELTADISIESFATAQHTLEPSLSNESSSIDDSSPTVEAILSVDSTPSVSSTPAPPPTPTEARSFSKSLAASRASKPKPTSSRKSSDSSKPKPKPVEVGMWLKVPPRSSKIVETTKLKDPADHEKAEIPKERKTLLDWMFKKW